MRRVVAVGVVMSVLLVVGLLAAGATPAAADTTTNQNVTADEITNEWTLAELQQDGTSAANAPASVRMDDRTNRMYWVVHWPAELLGSGAGDPDGDGWKHLERGETVERNSVYLRSINQGESETVTVVTVYYDEGEREVTRDNETTTVDAPKNVQVYKHEVELERGWSFAEVDLPRTDDSRQVTMWIEGSEDDLRWTFEHESVATTQPISIDTWGDFISTALLYFVGPILLGTFLVGSGAKYAINRASIGPQWGYARWMILLGVIAGLAMILLFTSIAQLIVNLPFVISAFVVLVIGVVILETYTSNVDRVQFYQPTLEYTESPEGEGMRDQYNAKQDSELVVQTADNDLAVVRPGLLPFLSRLFGGAAKLQGAEKMETAVNVEGSSINKKIYTDPEAESPIEYQPEGWAWELPVTKVCPSCDSKTVYELGYEEDDEFGCSSCEHTFDDPSRTVTRDDLLRIGAYITGIGAAVYVVMLLSGSPILAAGTGLVLGVTVGATPTNGYARFEPAEGMTRKAETSVMMMEISHDEFRTFEAVKKRLTELASSQIVEREKAVSDYDQSLVQYVLGDEDPDPSLISLTEGDDEEVSADDD